MAKSFPRPDALGAVATMTAVKKFLELSVPIADGGLTAAVKIIGLLLFLVE